MKIFEIIIVDGVLEYKFIIKGVNKSDALANASEYIYEKTDYRWSPNSVVKTMREIKNDELVLGFNVSDSEC